MDDRSRIFDHPEARHDCPERLRHVNAVPTDWLADEEVLETIYGPAFLHVERVRGRWWAHNREYSTQISFCPWCGQQLQSSATT